MLPSTAITWQLEVNTAARGNDPLWVEILGQRHTDEQVARRELAAIRAGGGYGASNFPVRMVRREVVDEQPQAGG